MTGATTIVCIGQIFVVSLHRLSGTDNFLPQAIRTFRNTSSQLQVEGN